MKKKYEAKEPAAFPLYFCALDYNPCSGNLVATGYIHDKNTDYIEVWTDNTLTQTQCYEREPSANMGTCIAISYLGNFMLVASLNNGVDLQIYNGNTFSLITACSLITPPYRRTPWGGIIDSLIISQPVFSPIKNQESLVMIPCSDGRLRLCNVETGQVEEFMGFPKADTMDFFAFVPHHEKMPETKIPAENKNDTVNGWIMGGVDRLEFRCPERMTRKYFFSKMICFGGMYGWKNIIKYSVSQQQVQKKKEEESLFRAVH